MKLLNDGDEISFLEMTGFNFAAFRSLRMILFEPEITEALAGVRPRGRPSQLDFDGQLGLYLYFVNNIHAPNKAFMSNLWCYSHNGEYFDQPND